MNQFNQFYNKPTDGDARMRFFFSLFSVPFIFIFLGLDSLDFAEHYFDGRWLVNFIVIIYFFTMLQAADSKLRRLMIIMVPLSYIGEITFCNILDMYDYRQNRIPLYVPFGHAILYGSAYMFHQTEWALKHKEALQKYLFGFFAVLFAIVSFILFDVLSAILGILFYRAMKRKLWNPIYYYVGLYVLLVEYTGTYFGVWEWDLIQLGFIPTLNPPVGAVYLYVGGDAVLLRVMRFIDKKNWLRPIGFEREKEVW